MMAAIRFRRFVGHVHVLLLKKKVAGTALCFVTLLRPFIGQVH